MRHKHTGKHTHTTQEYRTTAGVGPAWLEREGRGKGVVVVVVGIVGDRTEKVHER